jgi:hypothetical protein
MAGCHIAKASSASSSEDAYELPLWLGYLKSLLLKRLSRNVRANFFPPLILETPEIVGFSKAYTGVEAGDTLI